MKESYLKFPLILFILLSPATSSFAAPVEVGITSGTAKIDINQDFTINISIDPVNNSVTGAQFNLLFDSSVLEIKNITEGTLFKQKGAETAFSSGILDKSEGTLSNVWGLIISRGENVSTKGVIATITMNAKGTGNSHLNFTNVIVSDPNSKAVQLNITNGSISVAGGNRNNGHNNNYGASGSGGGGGGGISGENFSNIEIKEKYDRFINKDLITSYVFKNADPIISVNITGNISAGEINVAVEVLRNTSSLVNGPAPDNIYKNINIWVGTSGFANPANLKHADIIFRVNRSWMEFNGIDPESINMMHYNGKWETLPIKKLSETYEWIYYEASTVRFSPHAITGKRSDSIRDETSANTASQQTKKHVISVENRAESPDYMSKLLIIGAFMGVVLNVSLIYMVRKPTETLDE